jgi:hypothetical protein
LHIHAIWIENAAVGSASSSDDNNENDFSFHSSVLDNSGAESPGGLTQYTHVRTPANLQFSQQSLNFTPLCLFLIVP